MTERMSKSLMEERVNRILLTLFLAGWGDPPSAVDVNTASEIPFVLYANRSTGENASDKGRGDSTPADAADA